MRQRAQYANVSVQDWQHAGAWDRGGPAIDRRGGPLAAGDRARGAPRRRAPRRLDVSLPERALWQQLGAIGRSGCLAAAMDRSANALRLAGELDFDCATAVGDTLHAQFHGPLRLDLADLRFIDVTGLRALRGRTGQLITVIGGVVYDPPADGAARLGHRPPTPSWSRPHERHAARRRRPAIPERPASGPARRRARARRRRRG